MYSTIDSDVTKPTMDSSSSPPTQSRYCLTEAQLNRLYRLINDAKTSEQAFNDGITQLWRFLLGDDCFDEGNPQIQCTMHAIPRAQSVKILYWLCDKAGPLGSTSIGLNYINISPSSYDE